MSEAMTEAMSDAIDAVREHVPSLPSAKETKDAVLAHLPASRPDISVVRDRLPRELGTRRRVAAIVVGVATVLASVLVVSRRRRDSAPTADMYTPPLPPPARQ